MKFKHLRSKLITAYVAVFMIVILVFAGILYPSMKKSIENSVDEALTLQIELIKTGIESSLDAALTSYFRASAYSGLELVEYYYSLSEAHILTEEEARGRLYAALEKMKVGDTGYFVIISDKNIILSHPFEDMIGVDSTEIDFAANITSSYESYFSYLWKNSNEVTEREKSMYSIYFEPWGFYVLATGYKDEFNELVRIEDLEDQILSIKFGETGYPIVFDLEGNFLVHPSFKGVNMSGRDDAMGDITRKALKLRNGKSDYLWKNEGEETYRKKVTVFSEIEGFDMIVATTAYESEFMEPLYELTRLLVITLVVALVVVLILSYKVSDNITQPIIHTKELMDAAESGDLSVRCEVKSNDEVGSIAIHFNNFLDSLQKKQNSLIQQLEKNREISEELQASMDTLQMTQEKLIEEERFSNVGRVVTRVSHHLNTPLGNAIMSHSFVEQRIHEMKRQDSYNLSASQLKVFLSELEEASALMKRSLDSISQIINSFNRLNTELHSGDKQTILLNEFLDLRYMNKWRSRITEKVEISIQCEPDISIKVNPGILEIIMDQLTENALIHGIGAHRNGQIQIQVTKQGQNTRILFQDNGIGIPADRVDHIFEPFFDPVGNMSTLSLGLNMVYNAVKFSMKGTIRYESNEPSGTRFIIVI